MQREAPLLLPSLLTRAARAAHLSSSPTPPPVMKMNMKTTTKTKMATAPTTASLLTATRAPARTARRIRRASTTTITDLRTSHGKRTGQRRCVHRGRTEGRRRLGWRGGGKRGENLDGGGGGESQRLPKPSLGYRRHAMDRARVGDGRAGAQAREPACTWDRGAGHAGATRAGHTLALALRGAGGGRRERSCDVTKRSLEAQPRT